MARVTALRVQTRNQNRVNIYLDGEFAFGLVKVEAIRLRVGQELTEADIERLKAADEQEQAYERALKFLEIRPRSAAEVSQRLRAHSVPAPIVEKVIARLTSAGLLNDQTFANYWVENRQTFRPRSRLALRQELQRKGVRGEALTEALAATDDEAAAYQVAKRQAARWRTLDFPTFRRKLGEFLARRGFGFEVARTVVDRVWQEQTGQPAQDDDLE